jgi:hypothetical protein
MIHTLRGECAQEEQGKGRKPKTWMWLMCSLYRSKSSNLKLAESTVGRGPGSSEESDRDEPMWVAIHKCMEATIGISLYSYLYLKLVKTLCLSCYLLCFLFNEIR